MNELGWGETIVIVAGFAFIYLLFRDAWRNT